MTDIYDIKANILGLPINLFYSLVFVLFYIFFYVILNKYLNKDKEKKVELLHCNSSTKKEEINYINILKNIEEKYLASSKEIFYSKLSELIRLFLEEKQEKPISKMTFEEIRSLNLEKNIENIIKDIYFKEFQKYIEDNEELRKKILEEVRSLVN